MQDHDDRIVADLMEQLIETGPDGMAGVFTALFKVIVGLAGWKDVNDADHLRLDPVMRQLIGGRAVKHGAASASTMAGEARSIEAIATILEGAPRATVCTNSKSSGTISIRMHLHLSTRRRACSQSATNDKLTAVRTLSGFSSARRKEHHDKRRGWLR